MSADSSSVPTHPAIKLSIVLNDRHRLRYWATLGAASAVAAWPPAPGKPLMRPGVVVAPDGFVGKNQARGLVGWYTSLFTPCSERSGLSTPLTPLLGTRPNRRGRGDGMARPSRVRQPTPKAYRCDWNRSRRVRLHCRPGSRARFHARVHTPFVAYRSLHPAGPGAPRPPVGRRTSPFF